LTQLRRWYARAGTPCLTAECVWDAATQRYTLTLSQSLAPTAYEERLRAAGLEIETGPLHIPVAVGLVQADGEDAPLRMVGENEAPGTRVLSLTETTQSFVFEDIAAAPVASLLRDFSAPVRLEFKQSDAELAHLMAHDSDAFNRWEAGQRLATRILLAGIEAGGAGTNWIPESFVPACGRVLEAGLDPTQGGSPALAAEALVLPAEQVLAEAVASNGKVIDPEAIHHARVTLRRHLATSLRAGFETVWEALAPSGPYAADGAQVGRRSFRNLCLGYLAESEDPYLRDAVLPRLLTQFARGGSMTDVIAALGALANLDLPERETALDAFYAQWQGEALVVDKWLQAQATARLPGTTERVRELMRHPAFDLKNPNKVYALVRSFCVANPRHFHAADGSGYQLASEVVIELQSINPQVASRLARSFDRWRQFDVPRQAHARVALERISSCAGLAREVAEVVGNALK
jgi:aminopeptidase N